MTLKDAEPDWSKAPLIRTSLPGPNAKESVERNNRYITNMSVRIGKLYPLVFNRAKEAVIEDVDGNLWFDFSSSITAVNAGHSNPRVVEAVKDQISRFSNCYEYPSYLRGAVAELLSKMTPGNHAKRVAFTSTGSESIEMALRFAEWFTEKNELFSLWEQYHGKTRGSSSLTTVSLHYRKSLTKLGNCYHIPYPWCDRCPLTKEYPSCGLQCLKLLDYVIRNETAGKPAAIIIEPILGNGCVVPPKDYWPALYEKCKEYNMLFIDDEVQVGCGRTGKMFGIEHFDVIPDIICTGKGLANGLPVGSTIFKEEQSETEHLQEHAGNFTSTFGGNPVIMAAAKASLEFYQNSGVVENAASLGEYIKTRALDWMEIFPQIGAIEGIGLHIGIEFVSDPKTRKPWGDLCSKIMFECFKKGLLIFNTGRYGSFLKINPPLVITREQVDKGLEIIEQVIRETRI